MKVRSLVGLIPLCAVSILEPKILERFPGFKQRTEWFIQNRTDLTRNIACMQKQGVGERRLLAITSPDKFRRILQKMLDETEFVSPCGIRSVSKVHASHPYTIVFDGF